MRRSTKARQKTTDLQQLAADPDLRDRVTTTISAAFPHIPNTCISDTDPDFADVIFSILTELRPQRLHGPQGRFEDLGVQLGMNAEWKLRRR